MIKNILLTGFLGTMAIGPLTMLNGCVRREREVIVERRDGDWGRRTDDNHARDDRPIYRDDRPVYRDDRPREGDSRHY